nr:hypothetical protein [Bradyrhizobium prioritasuperba]
MLMGPLAPAQAEIRILASPGGEVKQFLRLFGALRETGETIAIDGPCYSACTLVLGTIPQDRICVTRRARLGFHAARLFDDEGRESSDPRVNRAVLYMYPPTVRDWILRNGGLRRKTIVLRGRALAAMYPRCS